MKLLHKIGLFLGILSAMPLCMHGRSVRDLKYEITDTAIVFPESVQADVHQMQQNWYLRNYTVLDSVPSSPVPVTDRVLISRLAAIPTTIEMPFNQVVKSHISLYVDRRRSLVETMLGLSLFYMPIFEEVLEREGMPLELRNLPIIESALNPDAVSRAGATGLWQIMLATARGLGLEINTLVDERRDPLASTEAAVKYLKQLYGIYNDWSLAIAAYNCGPGNVNKALTRAGASAENPKDFWDIYYYLPAETRGYVPGFIGATYAMRHYADHGISPALARRPILTDTLHINSRLYFTAIAQVLGIQEDELRTLNPQYRQGIIPGDLKPYTLRLPSQMVYNFLLFEDSIKSASARMAPRTVVEIGTITDESGVTYREVTKWHRVRRGETISQIARRYGVSVRQIKRWNKLRSNKLRRGAKIKIVTRERVATPTPATQPADTSAAAAMTDSISMTMSTDSVAHTDSISVSSTDSGVAIIPDTTIVSTSASTEVKVSEPKPASKPKPVAKPRMRTHRVKRGETLYAIAKKYGVTVNQIRRANNISGSNISVGQRLKIPSK